MRPPHVVGIGGTTRAGSGTDLAVRHVLRLCEKRDATTRLFSGADLESLPHYAPEREQRFPWRERSLLNSDVRTL
jgi:FMN reductase